MEWQRPHCCYNTRRSEIVSRYSRARSHMPGQLLLHYRVMEKIGEGGQGTVYKVIDTTLDVQP